MGSVQDDPFARHWLRWVLLFWAIAAIAMIASKWGAIRWFALLDTDDNLRLAEVRAWLDGQAWFDLRQYKLDPPGGANIHWSRLVDLPIAGLILGLRPFLGGIMAEKWAAAIAPLFALGASMAAMALAVRRLVAPAAFALGLLILVFGGQAMAMWTPLRIDHHGWQLAFLALAVAGMADPRQARGGATIGIATALSLVIGLEMFPYLVLIAGITGLRWVVDGGEAERLRAYGVSLAAGCAIGFLVFASNDNRGAVCDALSPVWLSAALGGGALLVGLSLLPVRGWPARLALAVLAAAVIGGCFALAWPHCLSRPEGVSPELDRLWLSKVREARPIYTHGWRVALPTAALPVIGLIGSLFAIWRARRTPMLMPWIGAGLLAAAAAAMLLWQLRAGAAAQLLAVPGAAALGWAGLGWARRQARPLTRIGVPALLVLVVTGMFGRLAVDMIPAEAPNAYRKAINTANRRCPTLPALRPIAHMPAATILTFVDFGPRLIAMTHHKAIAGPYHRNQQAILDVQHAFRGSAEQARGIIARHGVTMVLICPGMSESTVYASEAPHGFYARLRDDKAPDWLQPVALPKGSPFRLWRVRG
ncbi:hypothetical protein G432_08270 [Sphingomonas sp. MM-1]|uniref:hypothetical protein n=1 Tax=Sphingomonas sp. MM-1 TaxID=745310 RepID=UPI0002C14ED7|nr:hypothetical protein [Sphingomonas sp. MM-1]AGH49379.1 hypothetical protein G432_08270 [Sphingomonas sp. MM-1]